MGAGAGSVLIPKAASAAHQLENRQIFDFALSQEQLTAMSGLEVGRSLYGFRDADEFT